MKWSTARSGAEQYHYLKDKNRLISFVEFISPANKYAYILLDSQLRITQKWELLDTSSLRDAKKTVEAIVRLK